VGFGLGCHFLLEEGDVELEGLEIVGLTPENELSCAKVLLVYVLLHVVFEQIRIRLVTVYRLLHLDSLEAGLRLLLFLLVRSLVKSYGGLDLYSRIWFGLKGALVLDT